MMALAAGNATEANEQAHDDLGTHGDYHDTYSSATTLYWSGVGVVVLGAGLATWGLVTWAGAAESASLRGMELRPRTWLAGEGQGPMHGLVLSGRF